MYEVRVNGLRFHGFHGVYGQEKAAGNEFLASIIATVDGRADHTDRIEDTVDYAALARLLVQISDSGRFDTVEKLAAIFTEAVLASYPFVQVIEINLDKMSPVGLADVESCGVRMVSFREAETVRPEE